ncbi:MAG: phosphoenolpyruvate carboxylase [Candidatus Micrarchaeota archaeon]
MSTQHPDNITTPFFSDSELLAGEAEVKEAFFVFSQLGCYEQMWDSEGKEVDNHIVEKLLSRYGDFFIKKPLGKDFRLTYRVPNPSVEKEQGKILLETLHSIPRAFDVVKTAGLDIPPIFEVIIPMTTSHLELLRVKNYYEKIIIGQCNTPLGSEKIKVKEWVGDFQPESINIIPLFEDMQSLINCDSIVSKYLHGQKGVEYQRVFLARSDPALNYGSASAVLLSKIALQKLQNLQDVKGIQILPIMGVGGAPMRGNFTPNNVNNCGEEYPSVQTFTIQSSFKYDHPFRDVANAVDMLNHRRRRPALQIDEKRAVKLIEKMKTVYHRQIKDMADLVNGISMFIPKRRARKLHIGLFGYSRSLKGISLPRAIGFCASFYSIGIPPELLSLSGLNEKEFDELHELYVKVDDDLRDAAKFLNKTNLGRMPKSVKDGVLEVLDRIDADPDPEYCDITTRIYDNFKAMRTAGMTTDIKEAAWKRGFLG